MQTPQKAVQGGFSLLELIITLSILSILLAVALPAMQTFVRNQRKTAEVNLLIGALNYTRSEAVERHHALRLCSGSFAEGCQTERLWRNDWLLTLDEPMSRMHRTNEPLRVFAHSGDFFWRWQGAGGNAFIRFKADGSAAGSNGTFTLCYKKEALHQVVVNFAGRIRNQAAPANARCD
ncbi:hypothetical protein AXE65_04140 [Ventosimonas gracilis]|uniref:Type II secretion system protein H n=1 Tax=Ventosimonas gracilis TaxID=1680762 RepID=A0A139SR87_9GAMM|nr:GspH/FimT family pseudopilin [Ventosimonas gracilis]KXU37068.1 hypothetical protein AXE65_04140 [Ventosimonas gracilis]